MADRRTLLAAKLRALVDAPGAETDVFPGGAALLAGPKAWLLLDVDPLTALGPALVWAARRAATDVTLVVDREAAVVARRAALFSSPPTVLAVEGTSLVPAVPAPAPVPVEAPSAPDLAELLVDADLEVVVEDGIVRGEVLGLEVARIVHGTTTSGTPIDGPVLEVGVGAADREMTALVHAGLPPVDQLARVRDIVLEHRRPDAERHPLNQLAPERWLRSVLLRDPARIGCAELHPAPPAVPRPNLRDPAIAIARGRDDAGDEVVVACAVGVLLDFVPAAADARLAIDSATSDRRRELGDLEVRLCDPETTADQAGFQAMAQRRAELERIVEGQAGSVSRLLLVTPERDALPVTQTLVARLASPAELVPIQGDWRA